MSFRLTAVVAVVIVGLGYQSVDGQITGREPACGCYCSYPNYVSFDETPCTSRLREESCEDGMKELPPAKLQTICRRIRAKLHTKPDTNPCKQLFKKICPPHCEDISCYCGYSPSGGCAFAGSGSRQGTVKIYEGPSLTSAPILNVPNGTRLCYTLVMEVDGQQWFKVKPPGRPSGWVSSKDLVCRRPGDPLPLDVKSLNLDLSNARPTAAQVAGGRG